MIDEAGLASIAALLQEVLGPVAFQAKTSDCETRRGSSIEELMKRELYGNGYLREFRITERGGTAGAYFNMDWGEPLRVVVPHTASDTIAAIEKILKKYRAPYAFFANTPLVSLAIWSWALPFLLALVLGPLIRRPEATLDTTRHMLQPSPSLAPSAPSVPPVTPEPSSWDNLVACLVGLGKLAFGIAALALVLQLLRGPFRFCFPMVAFDVTPNKRRNELTQRSRWALLAIPFGIFVRQLCL